MLWRYLRSEKLFLCDVGPVHPVESRLAHSSDRIHRNLQELFQFTNPPVVYCTCMSRIGLGHLRDQATAEI
jgi:hypothetical protein